MFVLLNKRVSIDGYPSNIVEIRRKLGKGNGLVSVYILLFLFGHKLGGWLKQCSIDQYYIKIDLDREKERDRSQMAYQTYLQTTTTTENSGCSWNCFRFCGCCHLQGSNNGIDCHWNLLILGSSDDKFLFDMSNFFCGLSYGGIIFDCYIFLICKCTKERQTDRQKVLCHL